MALWNLPDWAQHFDKQLRSKLKVVSVTGAAANTNIAVAGAKVADTVLFAYNATDSKHQDTTGAKASVAMNGCGDGKLDSVFEATVVGDSMNEWKVQLRAGAALGIVVDYPSRTVFITYVAGVTTVANVEAAVTALAGAADVIGVKTAGTGATVLIAATAGTVTLKGGLSAGVELPKVTSAGNIQFPSAVTTGKTILVGYFVA